MAAAGGQLDLADFFADGLEPADVAPLYPLLGARGLISACIAVFRGGDAEVIVCLLVLREVGARADSPSWSPREFEMHLGFIDPVKLNHEKRVGSRWETTWLEFPRLDALREMFQLPDPEQLASDWASASAYRFDAADIAAAHTALASLPLARRLQRFSLLKSLDLWRDEERQGTRRDFSLLARRDSKGVTAAEWNWLAAAVDLERSGIFEHTPHLLVAGPIRLDTGSGIIDLNASADWAALTPETIATAQRCDGRPGVWRLIENRTSFERRARQRTPHMAVVWLPGFPPGWWQESMRHLLVGAPAPAEIACDPDPAGIAIALQAAKLWEAASLPWLPFAMHRDDLLAAPQRKPLTEHDRQQLAQLLSRTLPPVLRQLAATLLELGEKAEQEAYL